MRVVTVVVFDLVANAGVDVLETMPVRWGMDNPTNRNNRLKTKYKSREGCLALDRHLALNLVFKIEDEGIKKRSSIVRDGKQLEDK